jgi:hypothetical protein
MTQQWTRKTYTIVMDHLATLNNGGESSGLGAGGRHRAE